MSAELIKSIITDRSANNVMVAERLLKKSWSEMSSSEKADWNSHLKGMYNYTDFNRVEAAVEFLAERLRPLGYDVRPKVKTDWTERDVPTSEEMERYLGNVIMLCRDTLPFELPPLPESMEKLNFEYANNIELALLRLAEAIGVKEAAFTYYSGEIFAGEV